MRKLLWLSIAISVATGHAYEPKRPPTAAHDRASHLGLVTSESGSVSGVIVSRGRTLVRIDHRGGSVTWRRHLPTPADEGPVVAGAFAILRGCGGGFCLYGVDTETGQIKWTLDHTSKAWETVGGRSWEMATDGRLMYSSGSSVEHLFAVQAASGRIAWAHEPDDPRNQDAGFVRTILPFDGRLLTDFAVIDAATGRVEKAWPRRGLAAAAALGDILVVADADGAVSRLSPRGLDAVWKTRVERFDQCQVLTTSSAVVLAGLQGAVFVDRTARLTALDPASGATLWTKILPTTAAVVGAILAGDRDRIYASYVDSASGVGQVVAYGARTGQVAWKRDLATTSPPDPVVAAGEYLFLWDDSSVVALDSRTGLVRWRTSVSASSQVEQRRPAP